MKKIILSLLCLTILLCLTTGCGKKSVKKLMKERYDISYAKEINRENFRIDDDCGEDSYISAIVKDTWFSKIHFHVYEYSNYSLEWCSSYYIDDFKDIMLNKYFNSFKHYKKNLFKEYKTSYVLDNKYPLNKFKILGTFDDRTQLEALLDEEILFEEYILKQKYNKFVVPYVFTKNGDFNYEIKQNVAEEYSYRKDIPKTKEKKESLINEYLIQILQNYDVDAMKDFTDEEIQQELSKKKYKLGIKINDVYKYYDEYMLDDYGDISVGTLYYFLQNIGYVVVGNQYNYTTTINSHILSCNMYSNEVCRIDNEVDQDLISNYSKKIDIRILNDLLNLNICAKSKSGYIIE